MKEENYPSELFKSRGSKGVARYVKEAGRIYKDTTCRDHTPCLISVKYVDGHYELDELKNESAKDYAGFHQMSLFDSQFHPTKSAAKLETLNKFLKYKEEAFQNTKRKLVEAKEKLSNSSEKEIKPHLIKDLNFGQTIFIDKGHNNYDTDTIDRKISTKDGLRCWLTTGEYIIHDSEHEGCFDIIEREYSDDWYESEHYLGFLSREDYENFLFNKDLSSLKDDISTYEYLIPEYKEEIGNIKQEIANCHE
jgi:hypothetical protein